MPIDILRPRPFLHSDLSGVVPICPPALRGLDLSARQGQQVDEGVGV